MDLTVENMLGLLRAKNGSKLQARLDIVRLIIRDMELKLYKKASQRMTIQSSGPVLQAAAEDILSQLDVKRTEWDDKKEKILDAVEKRGLTRPTVLENAEKQLVEHVELVGNAFGDDLALVLANIPNIGKLWQHPDPRSRVMMFLLELFRVKWENCSAERSLDMPQYPVEKRHCRDSNDDGVEARSHNAVTPSVAQFSHPSDVDFDFKQQPSYRYSRPKRPLDESSGQPAPKRFCLANILNEEAVFEVSSPIVAANISNQENPVSKVSIPEKHAVPEVDSLVITANILRQEEEDPAPEVSSPVVTAKLPNTADDIQTPTLLLWERMRKINLQHPVVRPRPTGSTNEFPLEYDSQIPIPGSNDSFIFYKWHGWAGVAIVGENQIPKTEGTRYYFDLSVEMLPYKELSSMVQQSEHWKKAGGRGCLRIAFPCDVLGDGPFCRLICIIPTFKAPFVQKRYPIDQTPTVYKELQT
jgi:hypothetical protein